MKQSQVVQGIKSLHSEDSLTKYLGMYEIDRMLQQSTVIGEYTGLVL